LIKDRLSGVSFSFYTKAEIKSLSVVEVTNTQTFDHLANPHTNGLHDKRMGVSPFDRSSSCLTCGLTSNYCPGHHGHIELVAPIYNPFMIKDLYRLMKAKCFSCNRLRINETKIEVLTNALKFVKTGDIMSS
jgi:DNA-directed RNA polymerase I subunit RPA1